MKYAIFESGGKQYRAVEGGTVEVDRLPVEAGQSLDIERVLLMVDGDDVMVGAPVVSGIRVKATVLEHIKGPKVVTFKYRPKKRYRVKGGHRQQYTVLRIEQVGQAEVAVAKAEADAPVKKQAKARKEPSASETAE
jgi:large subunit ribosomal protein L21